MSKYSTLSDLDVLRMAERERGKAMAAFFRKLLTKRADKQSTGYTGGAVAAE
ncbi:MAG: hypothetical protein JJ899_03150 [Alphaproteobacteria bacterium]|nr:hypothetical protein [Alphaproteobacteria bacterium]